MSISKKETDFLNELPRRKRTGYPEKRGNAPRGGVLNPTLRNKFKKMVLHAFPHRIKSVALFGSRATGRAKKNSDYDVFIIVDRRDRTLVDTLFDIAYDIYIESNLTFHISPVIMSEEFFNARLSQERRIAREIVEQGIPL